MSDRYFVPDKNDLWACHDCGGVVIADRERHEMRHARRENSPPSMEEPSVRPTNPVTLLDCGHWQPTAPAATASMSEWCGHCQRSGEAVGQYFPPAPSGEHPAACSDADPCDECLSYPEG